MATAYIQTSTSVTRCNVNADAFDAAARELGNRAIGRVADGSDDRAALSCDGNANQLDVQRACTDSQRLRYVVCQVLW